MELIGSRGSPSDPTSCRLKDLNLRRLKSRTLLLVCLDPAHGLQIHKESRADLFVASCPLQVKHYLDEHPRHLVILDRCRASLRCCRRPLGELQNRIHQVVHGNPERMGLTHPPELLQSRQTGHLLTYQVQEAYRQLGGRSPQRITLRDLADLFAVSPRQLNRLFHLAVGIAPMQAFRRQRLLEAFQQIQASSRSIEAIAEDLHYHDRSSFSRAFRRAFGFYPGMLKKRPSNKTP